MNALRHGVGWIGLAAAFVWELASATRDTIRAVLSDGSGLRPAILALPLDVKSDIGITLFADMVTLTPGTTSLDVSADRQTLFVHVLDSPNAQATVASLKSSLENRVRRVLP